MPADYGIKWQRPPAPRGRALEAVYSEAARALRERPNTWARIAGGVTHSQAYKLSTGRIRAFAATSDWEFQLVQLPDGNSDVYARFVGEVLAWPSAQ